MLTIHQKPEALSFDSFYQAHYSQVLKYLNAKMGNMQDAEDLTQDIFTYCYQRFDTYDPEKASPTTWLYVIVNSRFKNYLRDRKLSEDIDDYREVIPDGRPENDSALLLQELRDKLALVLERLPERSRKLVVMRFFGDMSMKQIAAELSISEVNARVILLRTLKSMQRDLADFHFD